MNILKKLTGAVLLLVAVALLLGCGRRHEADEYYVMVVANKSIPYWQTAASGFYEAARQMNVKAEVVGPDNYDPNAEKQEFQRILAKKPAGIIISAADPELMKSEIDAAASQGIPVITIDADSPNSNRLYFVGTNNYQAGTIGGEAAAKQLNGKGNVIVFTIPTQLNLVERMHGYRDVFAKYPGIKVVREVDMKGDPRIVFDQVQAVLDKKEAIDGFISLEAQGGDEIATVLNNNKVTGKVVVAMDTDDATLDGIKKGLINATIAQKPYTMGYVGIKAVDDYYHNKAELSKMASAKSPMSPVPAYVDTGVSLVDKSNVDQIQQAIQQSQTKK
ncbi:MAG TPA: substrate-binding domain-containing protein [Terriglobales bacterium]|nr:substrate-binding domain-containing protein [Terriglobales bacterium]